MGGDGKKVRRKRVGRRGEKREIEERRGEEERKERWREGKERIKKNKIRTTSKISPLVRSLGNKLACFKGVTGGYYHDDCKSRT